MDKWNVEYAIYQPNFWIRELAFIKDYKHMHLILDEYLYWGIPKKLKHYYIDASIIQSVIAFY